ncbi:hypothetical protein, partial [Candidatus Liberibacter asiaticus]|uniref:hypothetical protein n=1 Tax=Liberibacter asiaticus TaxID=34021 RepID=UPI001AF004B6
MLSYKLIVKKQRANDAYIIHSIIVDFFDCLVLAFVMPIYQKNIFHELFYVTILIHGLGDYSNDIIEALT